MVTKEDVKNLAALARLELPEEEVVNLTSEMDSILDYVGQIKDAQGDLEREIPTHHNIMREDVPQNEAMQYTEAILSNAPQREGNYLKVKKILGGNSDDII